MPRIIKKIKQKIDLIKDFLDYCHYINELLKENNYKNIIDIKYKSTDDFKKALIIYFWTSKLNISRLWIFIFKNKIVKGTCRNLGVFYYV